MAAKCSECQLEQRLEGVRPDVAFSTDGQRIAIEIQNSTLDVREISRRTIRYTELGMYVLWLAPCDGPKLVWRDDEETYVCRPKEWEKYLHAMYYGRMYFWQSQAEVIPYHFDVFKSWVEESHWFDTDGDERSAGGYYRTAKALKIPMAYSERSLHIVEDFASSKRNRFISKNWLVPRCNLWKDALSAWW
ncbi:MAG: competence protein CoiA family protein [Pseudomonadota bacterium]